MRPAHSTTVTKGHVEPSLCSADRLTNRRPQEKTPAVYWHANRQFWPQRRLVADVLGAN